MCRLPVGDHLPYRPDGRLSFRAGRRTGVSHSVLSLSLPLCRTVKNGPAVTHDRAVFYTIGAAKFAVEAALGTGRHLAPWISRSTPPRWARPG